MCNELKMEAVKKAFIELTTEEKDIVIDDLLKILYEETVGDAAELPESDEADFETTGPNAIYRYALNLALVLRTEREENDTPLYKKAEEALWEIVDEFDKNREE